MSLLNRDWMTLADFASWIDASEAVAKTTLDELDIHYVRIGSRGQYRISTASIADAFDVRRVDEGAEDALPSTAAATPADISIAPLKEEVADA